jgi:hypothetical protein
MISGRTSLKCRAIGETTKVLTIFRFGCSRGSGLEWVLLLTADSKEVELIRGIWGDIKIYEYNGKRGF